MLPWWLYSLTPRDQNQAVLRVWNQTQEPAAAASLNIGSLFTVPQEYVALITNWCISTLPGGGQSFLQGTFSFSISGDFLQPLDYLDVANTVGPTLGVNTAIGRNTYVLIPPGATISMVAKFGAAANPNTAIMSFAGVLIPRGTIQVN